MEHLPLVSSSSFSITVCYGIGSFSEVKRSRYQLAYLMLINSLLKPKETRICDPIFSQDEISFLKRRGFVISDNDVRLLPFFNASPHSFPQEACFSAANSPVLFFMPHCGRRLYSNLLCTNWGMQLRNVILIGNSFDGFVLRFEFITNHVQPFSFH